MNNLSRTSQKIIDGIRALTELNEYLGEFVKDQNEETLKNIMDQIEVIERENDALQKSIKVLLENTVDFKDDKGEIEIDVIPTENGYRI